MVAERSLRSMDELGLGRDPVVLAAFMNAASADFNDAMRQRDALQDRELQDAQADAAIEASVAQTDALRAIADALENIAEVISK
tara:strand:+ start:279 stop:530 length:252 start_codon:yes stop_codon:yes gene_type:complete